MPSVAEIYCFSDPDFKGDLTGIVDSLKAKGHRLLIGEDLEELTLLLQLANPTLIIYTLSREDSILEAPFQSLSKEALEKAMPMILIGPDSDFDNFTLYTPRDSGFDEVIIDKERLADVVDNLHRQSIEPPSIEGVDAEEAEPRLADVLGQGPDAVEIVTSVETTDKTRIATAVSRAGVVLVREEQIVEIDDPRLEGKMEVQHAAAAQAYSPAKPPPIEASPLKYRDEISAPFTVPTKKKLKEEETLSEAKWTRPVQIIAAAGAVILIGVFLYLSTGQSPSSNNEIVVDEKESTPPKIEEPEASIPKVETQKAEPIAQPTEVETSMGQEGEKPADEVIENSAIPFPATFRTFKAVFLFLDEWEERRFVKMIRGVPSDKIIRIIGHPTVDEVKSGRRSLGWSRAWTVHKYLVRRGVAPSRLKASLGKPVPDAMELDQNGKPRRRFVEIEIVDKASSDSKP